MQTFQMLIHFIVQYPKIKFGNITTQQFRKVCRYDKAVKLMWQIKVSSILNFIWTSNSTMSKKYCQLYSWRDKLMPLVFEMISAKCTSLNNHSLSVNCFFKVKNHGGRKKRQLIQLATQTNAQMPPQDNHWIGRQQKYLVCPHLSE